MGGSGFTPSFFTATGAAIYYTIRSRLACCDWDSWKSGAVMRISSLPLLECNMLCIMFERSFNILRRSRRTDVYFCSRALIFLSSSTFDALVLDWNEAKPGSL